MKTKVTLIVAALFLASAAQAASEICGTWTARVEADRLDLHLHGARSAGTVGQTLSLMSGPDAALPRSGTP